MSLAQDQRVRFLIVGATNTAIGYLSFAALSLQVFDHLRFGYLLSLFLSYAITIVIAFAGIVVFGRLLDRARVAILRRARRRRRPVWVALAIVTFVVAQTWIPVTNGPTGIGNIPRPEWFGGSTMGFSCAGTVLRRAGALPAAIDSAAAAISIGSWSSTSSSTTRR